MIEFIKSNPVVIPFAITIVCNCWVGIDGFLNNKPLPWMLAYFGYAFCGAMMLWVYFLLPEN